MLLFRLTVFTLIGGLFALPALADNKMLYRNGNQSVYLGNYEKKKDRDPSHNGEVSGNPGYWEDDNSSTNSNSNNNNTPSRALTRNNNPANNPNSGYYDNYNGGNTGANGNGSTGGNRYVSGGGSNRYLATNSTRGRGTYNFQYGGYATQNRYFDTGYVPRNQAYNYVGDPARYNGAPYQNYRGYDNFAYGYNLGYYGH